MAERDAIEALLSDLHAQIDQFGPRGIKNAAGHTYYPSYYKRGLDRAVERGGTAVSDYVRGYLDRAPSDGYRKLEVANALDLACEYLIADESKSYAALFTGSDRTRARARLAPHMAAIEARIEAVKQQNAAGREKIRAEGAPRRRNELDDALRSNRPR